MPVAGVFTVKLVHLFKGFATGRSLVLTFFFDPVCLGSVFIGLFVNVLELHFFDTFVAMGVHRVFAKDFRLLFCPFSLGSANSLVFAPRAISGNGALIEFMVGHSC
jgi:hypothetical protein